MANPGALATLDPMPVLARLQSGESLRTIAADLGVSNVGLRAWLLREDREQYSEVITAALTTRVAEADERLDEAEDAVSIARAREQARFARMDYERRRPSLYGQRPSTAVQINGSGEMQVQIVSYASNNAPQQPVATSTDSQQDS
jgi:CRISPR/Cas system Type II protein with McrA/HNH and RuvC-like nuclease domain